MQPFEKKPAYRLEDLIAIVRLLRAPGGCPWDREQTHQSLKGGLVEETYEVLDAIDRGSAAGLREELGDVLLQVVFHARLEEENGGFTFDDVCDGVCKKLIYRHPHVFGTPENAVQNADQVLERWDALKDAEKDIHTAAQDMAAVPAALPALMRAKKVQKRAARHGFGQTAAEALQQAEQSLATVRDAAQKGPGAAGQAADDYGQALLALTDVGRQLGLDAEQALTDATNRLIARVGAQERQAQQ